MTSPYIIKMPQLSDTMTDGVVVSWEKNLGDKVNRGDIVATVETDKAIMDVEVFKEGYLSRIADIDSVIPVGEPMGYLVETEAEVTGDASGTVSNSVDEAPAEEVIATAENVAVDDIHEGTHARQFAGEHGIDLNSKTSGSGSDSSNIAADVLNSNVQKGTSQRIFQVPGEGRAMSAMEKAVAHNMEYSLSMPLFRITMNVDPSSLRAASKAKGFSLTVTLAKAAALAIQKHPMINSVYQYEDKIVEREQVDVGVAVTTDGMGLVVPVIRDAANVSLTTMADNWSDLVTRARARRLKPEEYLNPTFTISNMGMMGVAQFDAIPSPGTSAIFAIAALGPHGMPVTMTADHRIINGAGAAKFLNTFKDLVENPTWLDASASAAAGITNNTAQTAQPNLAPLNTASFITSKTSGFEMPKGDYDYDVVVIGGGPGGEDAARVLVEHGLKVAMINDAPFPGGECLWRGCIPSKAWRAAADRIRDRAEDAMMGIKSNTKPDLNWKKLEEHRKGVLETRGKMALNTDKGVKIDVIQGFAHFIDDHNVFIDTTGNSKDPHTRNVAKGDAQESANVAGGRKPGATQQVSFGVAIIATGARPFVPRIPGAHDGVDAGGVLTSDTVWGLKEIPKRLGVIGGGAIGVEMAQIFQDFGTKVKLFEDKDRILVEAEPEIAWQLTEVLNNDPRLTISTNSKISEIKGKAGDMKVLFVDGEGKKRNFGCDYVIMATGKRPVLEPLNIDAAGIEVEAGMIKVNAQCQTNKKHIFAVGDVNGGLMLAHTASQQGRVAATTICGEYMAYDQNMDSGVIFTRPEAAFVGLSTAQAKQQGIDAVEIKVPMSIDAKAMINGETHGLIKIVADKSNHRVIGVHFLADHADTLIGEGVMMVSGQMTLEQVGAAIHPHPTQTELFGDMARRLSSRLKRAEKRKKK